MPRDFCALLRAQQAAFEFLLFIVKQVVAKSLANQEGLPAVNSVDGEWQGGKNFRPEKIRRYIHYICRYIKLVRCGISLSLKYQNEKLLNKFRFLNIII